MDEQMRKDFARMAEHIRFRERNVALARQAQRECVAREREAREEGTALPEDVRSQTDRDRRNARNGARYVYLAYAYLRGVPRARVEPVVAPIRTRGWTRLAARVFAELQECQIKPYFGAEPGERAQFVVRIEVWLMIAGSEQERANERRYLEADWKRARAGEEGSGL